MEENQENENDELLQSEDENQIETKIIEENSEELITDHVEEAENVAKIENIEEIEKLEENENTKEDINEISEDKLEEIDITESENLPVFSPRQETENTITNDIDSDAKLTADATDITNEDEQIRNIENEVSVNEIEVDPSEFHEETSDEFVRSFLMNVIDSALSRTEAMTVDEKSFHDKEDELVSDQPEFPAEYHEIERIEEIDEPEEQPDIQQEFQEMDEYAQHDRESSRVSDRAESKFTEEQIEMPIANRDELIHELKSALSDQKFFYESGISLEHKIGDYLRKKKSEQPAAAIVMTVEDKSLIDFEEKYRNLTQTLGELIERCESENYISQQQAEKFQKEASILEETVNQEKEKIRNHRSLIGQKSIYSRTGKGITSKDLDAFLAAEDRKEFTVVEVRLESIKLQNEVDKIDSVLKSKEELADGLHLIDFEQFKIENQSYNEKLEERTEDITKLRKKICTNVHILTHVKEKLENVNYECEVERKSLDEIDSKLKTNRDNLTHLKKVRDRLRTENQKLKMSCGMLGNRDLLRNYEDSVDSVDVQKQKLNDMKNSQMQLSLRSQALQMKIDNVKLESAPG